MDIWGTRSPFLDGVREFLILIDRVIYMLLDFIYQVFFQVANFELFTDSSIPALFSRIQLLLGIFMVFKLSFSIINGIINPDAFVDKKAGFGNVVMRTITMLFVLLLVVPISIPNAETSFEKDINNNGILFGTLYNLQERIMYGNTIGRIILGTPVETVTEEGEALSEEEVQEQRVQAASDELGVSVLKTFIQINYDNPVDNDPANKENFACKNLSAQIYNLYHNAKNTDELFALANMECDDRYAMAYIPVISGITGAALVVIIFGFTLDIAIRTVKLTVLRLVAPIPIVTYIDPKSAKDGAFGSWVKVLSATYLDLFFRLAIIYFGVYLVHLSIEQFTKEAVDFLNDPDISLINVFTFIMIVVGIFYFMRMSPKFLKDMFGIKGPGLSNFGLSGIVSGAGSMAASIRAGEVKSLSSLGAALGEASRAGSAGRNMQLQAYNQGKAAPGLGQTYTNAADNMMKTITGNDKMTMAQYGSNMRFANRNKLGDNHLDDEKNYMYALDEEYKRAASMKEAANMGRLSHDDSVRIGHQLAANDSKYAVDYNDAKFMYRDEKTGELKHDNAAYDRAVADQLQNYVLDTETKLNKQKSKVGDIEQERKIRGLDRRFGYNNKYDARRGAMYHPENYKNDRSGFVFADKKSSGFSKSYRAGAKKIKK